MPLPRPSLSPPGAPIRVPGQSPIEKLTARMMLAGVGILMDDYAQEIFDLWFSGKAPPEVVFENEKWSSYMRKNDDLTAQISAHMARFGWDKMQELRSGKHALAPGVSYQKYKTSFLAIVGGAHGGYRTGYEVLHCSNVDVGDFQIEGTMQIIVRDASAPNIEILFVDNTLTFNDIVDPNPKFNNDTVLARTANNMARTLGGPPPRDYILRIRWKEPGPWRPAGKWAAPDARPSGIRRGST